MHVKKIIERLKQKNIKQCAEYMKIKQIKSKLNFGKLNIAKMNRLH